MSVSQPSKTLGIARAPNFLSFCPSSQSNKHHDGPKISLLFSILLDIPHDCLRSLHKRHCVFHLDRASIKMLLP
ncbi:hypothetical protein Csa_011871 [Cucumis sativus]|uniref:Uncharacterized protein n=1 Tax=Cucumis sativus TaxID=3659 RepID=A0A0A0K6Y9_CUCSA|nr:hypothetical protein Csa_011871 [Cucumis sativus]